MWEASYPETGSLQGVPGGQVLPSPILENQGHSITQASDPPPVRASTSHPLTHLPTSLPSSSRPPPKAPAPPVAQPPPSSSSSSSSSSSASSSSAQLTHRPPTPSLPLPLSTHSFPPHGLRPPPPPHHPSLVSPGPTLPPPPPLLQVPGHPGASAANALSGEFGVLAGWSGGGPWPQAWAQLALAGTKGLWREWLKAKGKASHLGPKRLTWWHQILKPSSPPLPQSRT